jgi:ATP-dependent DNA ligase
MTELKELTSEHITKMAKLFNLPESVFLPKKQMETNLNQVYSTELIEKLDAKSAKRLWRALVVKDNDIYYTQQEFWSIKQDGSESKRTLSALTKVDRKNVGKSNETSEEEQAIKEAIALYNKKLDAVLDEDNFLPMLAQPYNSKKVTYPAYINPKYDGIRCAVKPDKTFWTRKGKQIPPNIVEHIAAALPETNYILDGELILPKEYTFQETVSAVKKYNSHTSLLGLYVYDVYTTDTYENRYSYLQSLDLQAPLYLCSTEEVTSEEEFISKSLLLIEAGYEGSMYRSKSGLYKPNVRSADLLKYKIAEDAEFEIISVLEGKGKELGCAIFECKVNENDTVKVTPNATTFERKEMFDNKEKYIGKMYTIKFFGYTDKGNLRFPKGIAIRDYE